MSPPVHNHVGIVIHFGSSVIFVDEFFELGEVLDDPAGDEVFGILRNGYGFGKVTPASYDPADVRLTDTRPGHQLRELVIGSKVGSSASKRYCNCAKSI